MIEGRYSERGWKKGCCSKESYAIGEKVSVQNVVSKLLDRDAVIYSMSRPNLHFTASKSDLKHLR